MLKRCKPSMRLKPRPASLFGSERQTQDAGAGVAGVAIAITEALADVGGASAALYGVVQLVRKAYHKIASRTGYRPMISLGAAEYLAMADLINRVNSTPCLVGSGDVCSHSPDRGFTGGDVFFVVLAADTELHSYHVSAYGEVCYVGTSPPIRGHWDAPPPYWAGGDPDG